METMEAPQVHVQACRPDREAALERLRAFLPRLAGQAGRLDPADADGLPGSRLSPYIRLRLLRESEIVAAVLARYPYRESARFIRQLGRRTYLRGYLESHQGIWHSYKDRLERARQELPPARSVVLERACAGETGIDRFDRPARELLAGGWLSHPARMDFATTWMRDLCLPWELGAAHFAAHLLDADTASNLLAWRWLAGLQETDPVDTNSLPAADPLAQSYFPDLSCCPAGLVVTPEDLTPEMRELEEMPFNSICVFNARDVMAATHASPLVREFIDGAVLDAARRLARHWDSRLLPVQGAVQARELVATPDHVGCRERPRVYAGTVERWVESVLVWAGNENLKSVVLLQPPTGPWQDAMPALRAALRVRNIRLTEYRRRWDALHWPHATDGYFQFLKGLRGRIGRFLAPQR